jgi:hypothetical protein
MSIKQFSNFDVCRLPSEGIKDWRLKCRNLYLKLRDQSLFGIIGEVFRQIMALKLGILQVIAVE